MIYESQRRSERVFTNLEVLFSASDGSIQTAMVTDMSEHGMFVRTECAQTPGEIRFFEIYLPDGGAVGVFGLVRFVGMTPAGAGMGIQLLSMSFDEHERWMEHYRRLLPALLHTPTIALERAA